MKRTQRSEKAPFEPLKPNAETAAAMKAARRGKLVKIGKPDKLLRSLSEGSTLTLQGRVVRVCLGGGVA